MAVGDAGGGFGSMLGNAVGSLVDTQAQAAEGAQALAAGTADDPTAVVVAVERAQLAMQLASQVRNKLVEAATDIFHTQV
jgi:flagellar hook-basal body complex protein FliE